MSVWLWFGGLAEQRVVPLRVSICVYIYVYIYMCMYMWQLQLGSSVI